MTFRDNFLAWFKLYLLKGVQKFFNPVFDKLKVKCVINNIFNRDTLLLFLDIKLNVQQ